MTDVLVIQNNGIEGAGNLGRLLAGDGFDVRTVHAWREDIRHECDMLVILGAPESANDARLQGQQDMIRDHTARQKPVLGICLGSQLIARALGARVYRGPKKEIGFYHDLHPEGPLLGGLGSPFSAFHWHEDTFELPAGAVRLASSEHYPNQAFRHGTAVGLQFHLEADHDMMRLWLARSGLDCAAAGRIASEIDEFAPAVGRNLGIFYKNFKSEFGL